MTLHWKITEREAARPLVDAMSLRLPAAPRAFLRKTCLKGRVSRAGLPLDPETPVFSGELIELFVSQRMQEILALSPLQPGQVLFEDDHTLVLEKPAGLPTHRSSMSTDSLQEMAQAFVKARGESYRVSPVNRLDIGTSGPVMFGKGARSTGRLGELFMSGEVDKIYLALVCGAPPAQGVLHSPVPAHGKLKQAVTRYRRLSHVEGFTLLQLHLDTGRLHQLRRQLSAAGWPILGDIRYHGRAWPGLNHCFLHCCTLGFNRLENGSPVQIDCLLPAALCIILDQLGLAAPSTSGKGPNQA